MAQPERLRLPDGVDLHEVGQPNDLGQLVVLALGGERGLELGRAVEVVGQRLLAACRHEQHVGNAGGHAFLDDVLDRRPVDDRDGLLRDGLGRGQEPRAQPSHRQDGRADGSISHARSSSASSHARPEPRPPAG